MAATRTKLKKLKQKTHKASAKRFKVSGSGKLIHLPQGGGNGHSRNYKNRRQRAAGKGTAALNAKKEIKKLRLLIG